ncbi:MAG: TAXI family TRAP transporter solute-binding subunit [Pseudomonadota bacterium]|nr:TAXI family TRAP transporter solute-binding subunit [Pseudomonadota bacterium]
MNHFKTFAAAIALGGLTAGLPAQAQDTTYLTMDAFSPGTTSGQFGIAFSQLIQRELPVEIQISSGKPATKSAVDAAMEKVDLFTTASAINHYMQTNAAMFKDMANAPELNANLRNIITFPVGPNQFVTYADSGIETMDDFAGKTVFVGPPGSASTALTIQMIEAITGLKAGEDYETPRFDWQSAETAFVDRQMDVFIAFSELPSPMIQQFSMVSDIRMIGIPEDKLQDETIQSLSNFPGRSLETIEPGVYDNQVNDTAITTIGTWVGLGTHAGLDADLVYDMTKTLWENIDEIRETAAWMQTITKETALSQSNIPLHIGAYRYYQEAGFDIPEHMVPPEAE